MDLFWLEETDIPKGSGFSLFGTEHIAAIVLALISAWTLAFICCRSRKSGKAILAVISILLLLPAGLGAILFPDWTMYPVISFMSLSSFAWHTLQITLPLCIVLAGEVYPKSGSILYSIAFLLLITIPVYLFDRHFLCNYFFLLGPVPGPLETVYEKFGMTGYLPGLAIMVVLIILITYGLIRFTKRK